MVSIFAVVFLPGFKIDVLLSTVLFHCTVGVPIKLLHEAEKHVVTVELKNGEIYKGLLAEAEDTMNCQMKEGVINLQHFKPNHQ